MSPASAKSTSLAGQLLGLAVEQLLHGQRSLVARAGRATARVTRSARCKWPAGAATSLIFLCFGSHHVRDLNVVSQYRFSKIKRAVANQAGPAHSMAFPRVHFFYKACPRCLARTRRGVDTGQLLYKREDFT